MSMSRRRGFTLIELLTVIAIIAILASITFAVFPRIRERARLARAENTARSINTAFVSYFTDHASYPPAYGYLNFESRNKADADLLPGDFFLTPYLVYANLFRVDDMYDEFARGEGFDADNDGQIDLLEFQPIGEKLNPAIDKIEFPNARYNGSNLPGEVQAQLQAEERPMFYIPVNERQFKKASQYWISKGLFYAQEWDKDDPLLQGMSFPPADYDKYVLISVGPANDTFGIIPEPLGTESVKDIYHILALRAYFLATRDLDDNGLRDFDYLARTRDGEAQNIQYDVLGFDASNDLPSARAPRGAGPLIYSY